MNVEKGDIVQVTNDQHGWFPALVIVSEPKSFGCQGYTTFPRQGDAYIRLKKEDYEKVGRAIIVAE